MPERIILNATFNPAVKTYWLISLLLVSTISIVGIPFLIISIPIFFLISSKVLAAMSAIVTERKIVVKRGVFNKEEKSIPLEKITDVAMVQGPLMRVFNLYRLSFETAGQSAQGALVSLIGVSRSPQKVNLPSRSGTRQTSSDRGLVSDSIIAAKATSRLSRRS